MGWIAAGVALAAALGVGVGLSTRQDIGDEPGLPDPPLDVATSPTVPIEVAAAAPPPQPVRPDGRLEVLPPDMAKAAAASVAKAAPQPLPVERPNPVAETAQAPPAVPASARVADPPSPAVRPSFDCRDARTPSERMVCADEQLARLDRRLNRAFESAVAAGVPYRPLREDQDDWLRIRDDAARRAGRDGVASVYRQRIAELSELAREANGPY